MSYSLDTIPTPEPLNNPLTEDLLLTLERSYLLAAPGKGLLPVNPDPNWKAKTRFFHISEISHLGRPELSLHALNMQNVLSTFRDGTQSVVFAVAGRGDATDLYIGLYQSGAAKTIQTGEYIGILGKAFEGNFASIQLSALTPVQINDILLNPMGRYEYAAAITGIPSLKQDAQGIQVQGLERIINGLRGTNYLILVIAEPINELAINQIIQNCRDLGSQIHAFVHKTLGTSYSHGTSDQVSRSGSLGAGMLMGAGGLLGGLAGFGAAFMPLMQGIVGALQLETGRAETRTESESTSISRQYLDKTAEFCERLLDNYITRLQMGKNLGFWNTGIFLLADNSNTLYRGQGVIRAVLSGEKTYFEPMRSLDLSRSQPILVNYLAQFRNPLMKFPELAPPQMPAARGPLDTPVSKPVAHPISSVYQSISTPMNTAELSLVIGLPHEEVPGIPLSPITDFGINPPETEGIDLGRVMYRGRQTSKPFRIVPKSLTKHTFVTGITGSGKTNTCLALLRASQTEQPVPFLVIEPAKQEYRPLLADEVLGRNLQIFTLSDERISPFRLNPFQFPVSFPVLTHIDLLKAVFNASFPMYASMPYILEESILDVYTDRGWNLATSTNRFFDVSDPGADYTRYLPTLRDLYTKIDVVVDRKGYAKQITMDMSAALKARIKSLMVGGKGLMLNCARSYPLDLLFNRPTVMELKQIGDDAEKAFIMALLLINLYEYCETSRTYSGQLQHLTLIEEAHRLLKNIPLALSAESANPRGKAVEMFTDILAEIREYGEGFVIVDQIPAKLTPDALKNTNLKILHRLVAEDDRESVGNAMNLSSEQKSYLVRLPVGQAVVHNDSLDTPILLQIHPVKDGLRDRYTQTIGVEGLKKQMAARQREVQDMYRRWPSCKYCASPCRFLSEAPQYSQDEYDAFQNFVSSLLHGSLGAGVMQWKRAKNALEACLRRGRKEAPVDPSLFECTLAQLIHVTLHERQEYYRGGYGGYRTYICQEELLLEVTRVLSQPVTDPAALETSVGAFRAETLGQLAAAPLRKEPGCAQCKAVCQYGYIVQRDLPEKAARLAVLLKEAAREKGFPGNYPALVDLVEKFSQEVTPFPIMPEQAHALAFCYLVNAGGRKPHVLSGFQKAAEK